MVAKLITCVLFMLILFVPAMCHKMDSEQEENDEETKK